MSSADAFPEPGHDHGVCVADILAAAERVCADHRVRLTAQRRRVLEIVAEKHAAVGAYEIMDRMAEQGRRPAPVTVYRALEFLIDNGLVHRLASLNAFIACAHPGEGHAPAFLICRCCDAVAETRTDPGDGPLDGLAAESGFVVERAVIEAVGICPNCRDAA